MKRAAATSLPIPVDGDLKRLIENAAAKTHLSQADVMRSALRIGVPEVMKRLEVRQSPRRNLIEYLDAFAGIIKPGREFVAESRFR